MKLNSENLCFQIFHFRINSNDDEYLQHLTLEGAKERWGDKLTEEISDRLAYELRAMSDMISAYFLYHMGFDSLCARTGYQGWARRGSAAGSAVAYALKIADLDLIEYDLLFERFLNPSRISMPDIDI